MPPDTRSSRLAGDRLLLDAVDGAFAESARLAGEWCACRPGCTECCLGPFPINALDAWRLGEGLRRLEAADPARAESVRARAAEAVGSLVDGFPGDPATGVLGDDDGAEEAFFERHARLPCPALDPATGRCDLYAWRPVSCRTYGPPVRFGEQELPPCRLWFASAPTEAVERCRVDPDADDRERELLESMDGDGTGAETVVAFALARPRR